MTNTARAETGYPCEYCVMRGRCSEPCELVTTWASSPYNVNKWQDANDPNAWKYALGIILGLAFLLLAVCWVFGPYSV